MCGKREERWNVSLLDALEAKAAEPSNKGGQCWFQRLTQDDQDSLNRYFATEITTSKIGDALRSEGIDISDFRVGWHRRGKCKCR